MLAAQAPACPNWCNEHDDDTGWLIAAGSITKSCGCVLIDTDDTLLRLERFAAIEDGVLRVDGPSVRLESCGTLTRVDALRLAEALVGGVAVTSASLAA